MKRLMILATLLTLGVAAVAITRPQPTRESAVQRRSRWAREHEFANRMRAGQRRSSASWM